MVKKNYIIWGISDTGYKEAISSSYTDNALPSEFKASVSDKHRTIANYFSQENSDNDYFYSIERVGNNVLYTIYRTNWYRDNRLSYDAATIIIDKNHIIENSLHSLKLLIKNYVSQKESGVREFNFENVITQIKLRSKQLNEKRSISKKYKEGYIKYQSETDLNSIFSDSKDKLHNLKKVFFFTSLKYLEEGPSKLQNVNDYKEIPIRLINYDAKYYRIFVENKQVTVLVNTFNAYDGDEIKIYRERGNIPQKEDVAKEGLTIALKKIIPPKPTKPRNKKKKMRLLIITACSLLVLVILGFIFRDNLVSFLSGEKITDNGDGNNDTNGCKIELVDNTFTDNDGKPKTDPEELLECFKDDKGWIQIGKEKYKLDDIGNTIQLHKNKDWIIVKDNNELENLKKRLEKNDTKKVSKKVIDEIDKIINLNELTKKGLRGDSKTWKWRNKKLLHKETDEDNKEFKESIDFIQDVENIESLLKLLKNKPIPTSVLEDIKEYIKKDGSEEVRKYLETLEKEEEEEEEEELIKGCKNRNYKNYNKDADIKDNSLCKGMQKCKKCNENLDQCEGHSSNKCRECNQKEDECNCCDCEDGVDLSKYPKCKNKVTDAKTCSTEITIIEGKIGDNRKLLKEKNIHINQGSYKPEELTGLENELQTLKTKKGDCKLI